MLNRIMCCHMWASISFIMISYNSNQPDMSHDNDFHGLRNRLSDTRCHGFGAKFLLLKITASGSRYDRKSAFGLGSNCTTLLVQYYCFLPCLIDLAYMAEINNALRQQCYTV